ncbi:MAG: MBL fold metallo-hydrolase [Bacteroidia bacterium]|nr:MBL fold metallo-hydrolase [Bacteroidia bacterium]
MKSILIKILAGLVIIVILVVFLFGGYMIKAKSETKLMAPAETKVIVDNIISVKDSFVNLYLIKDSSQYIAVDAGNNSITVSGELKKLNIDPEKIIAVLLTHTDGDHVAAIKLFKNAKVYLSRQEEQLLNGKKSRFLIFGTKIDTKVYSLIDDQQIINFGNTKIKGILTPGHTFGSMCYLINDKYLFTGDAIGLKNGKVVNFNEFFNTDTKTASESIAKITGIAGAEFIFTAHYGYSDDYKNAVKDYAVMQK